ncbi:uncharacterized protein LOC126991785 [Eriocheir sinensis]|uniref:uncharacterized protein LOC126991785 n=1 Tax=Eriocheir sinensis TaxID=95602 RepID=UPI0021C63196|nr:uncharacterized protein LOC126991785 [Eriocheir sinensis]
MLASLAATQVFRKSLETLTATMARLLLPVMTVALAMVAGAMGQQVGCPSGYTEDQIPTLSLSNASKSELYGLVHDRTFGNLVNNCFFGKNCELCAHNDKVRQILVIYPWMVRECIQKTGVCTKDQTEMAVYIFTEARKVYPKESKEIIALINAA